MLEVARLRGLLVRWFAGSLACFAGWLGCWIAGQLVGWVVGWLAGLLLSWQLAWLVGWLVALLGCWPVSLLAWQRAGESL